ncbi:uncharacterized protein LOC128174476 [Crassostrea angulata]|uniref:uncharacterized protein LOC128174476 n=1 Tax=Magallana angulata TaxID=2784310 RepID=UPI0022B1D915|nr:uncharacterized protein LOC128174476 [Crassostrea angulata]
MLRLQALESRKNRKKKRKFGPTQNKFRRMLEPLQEKWNRNWKIQPQIKTPNQRDPKTSVKKAKSVGSRKSGLSNLSSVSTLYLKQKTKVEEARVRLKYAKQEAELLKERAALEAKMNILDKERQFEECNQGLNALNECFDLEPSDEEDEEEESNDSDTTDNRETRVKQYFEEQNRIAGAYSSQPNQ